MSPPASTQGTDQPLTVEAFLKTVLRSGLLTSQQLQVALQPVPPERLADAKFLADHLVQTGKLSRFQANKLLVGVVKGLVLGPFHMLAPIGKGGMGAVYLARDSRSQQLVAVKALPPKRAKAEERLLARFRREMEICQRVTHPNVARTFEVGVDDDVHYIAMEYIPGNNLYKLVSEQGALPVARAARLFQEVCLGLEHAHSQGLIHRDIKPSNIIITPDDHAKVLDLGLAMMQGEVQADRTVVGGQGYIVGTLDYLAPEQADDAFTVDLRSDIYALGCTLYFALTKQPPFPGGNALQKLLRHRTDTSVSVCRLNPEAPPEMAALVDKMMAKRKEERFATCAQVREALAAWAPSSPHAPAKVEPLAKPVAAASPAAPAVAPARPALVPASAPAAVNLGDSGPTSTASFVVKKNAAGTLRMPVLPRPAPQAPAAQAAAGALPVVKAPPQEPPNSWFVERPQQPAPAAPALPALPPTSAPVEPAPTQQPEPGSPSPSPAGLPFWLDYLVPVCAGGMFLFIMWLVGLIWLLKR
jgi:tRNA A-37 threonylcarbamoyl transferase component Bud32